MLVLIEMNLLPGGKRGVARPKGGRKLSLPKFDGLQDMVKGDPRYRIQCAMPRRSRLPTV
jgi:hypothetical protein